jgi:hypothetical protein
MLDVMMHNSDIDHDCKRALVCLMGGCRILCKIGVLESSYLCMFMLVIYLIIYLLISECYQHIVGIYYKK